MKRRAFHTEARLTHGEIVGTCELQVFFELRIANGFSDTCHAWRFIRISERPRRERKKKL